ncbi:MAG TPA: alcohol dehydrogenase [Anaerolineae bacterium]|nr:alcohol dehydrogenase [Anaerolineae bacterium]HIQ06052.1 alcohol dehydrogenase [Anaerolineae bacterium]
MRALFLDADGHVQLRNDYPVPQSPSGDALEALIRVRVASICNTDLELIRGYKGGFQGVLGHEFVGEVVAAPDPDLLAQRVVGEINVSCGRCETCLAGRPRHCPHRTVLGILGRDGAFADYLTLPVANLLSVPDDVPDRQAVFTEPLAAALEILEQVHIRPTDRVVVLGDGKLGLLVAQVLALTTGDLTVIGKHHRKLAILEQRGIRTQLAREREPFGGKADVVIECTGSPSGFVAALDIVRPMGTLVLKSTYADRITFDLSRLVADEVTVIGSRCGPFRPALRLLAEGRVDVEALIDAEYALDDGLAALEHAAGPGTLKVLLQVMT